MEQTESTTEGFPVQEECALSLVWRISQCRFGDELSGRAGGGAGAGQAGHEPDSSRRRDGKNGVDSEAISERD